MVRGAGDGAEVKRGCRHADDAGERGDWAELVGPRLRVRLSSCLCAESSISYMLVGSKPDVDCLKEKAPLRTASPCRFLSAPAGLDSAQRYQAPRNLRPNCLSQATVR